MQFEEYAQVGGAHGKRPKSGILFLIPTFGESKMFPYFKRIEKIYIMYLCKENLTSASDSMRKMDASSTTKVEVSRKAWNFAWLGKNTYERISELLGIAKSFWEFLRIYKITTF